MRNSCVVGKAQSWQTWVGQHLVRVDRIVMKDEMPFSDAEEQPRQAMLSQIASLCPLAHGLGESSSTVEELGSQSSQRQSPHLHPRRLSRVPGILAE